MDNPVAIVTGAGRGIGRAAAIEMARLGYRCVVASRNADELNETARLARGAVAVATDITRADQVEKLVASAVEKFGRLDVVVNCAGLAPVRSIEETTLDDWRAVLDTNLSAAFYLCRAAWPIFRKQKGGVIVNVSSFASRDPFPGFAAYGAAKAGLNLLGLALAREGAEFGIRVHTVAPAAVETTMFRQIRSHEQWPTEKTLDPAEVARVIGQCAAGDLKITSGEVIYLSKSL